MIRPLRTSVVALVQLALLTSLVTVPRAAGSTVEVTVTVDIANKYQEIAGFGVSEGSDRPRLMSAPATLSSRSLVSYDIEP